MEVVACEINEFNIKYKCPYCYTSYKKDGSPRKNAFNKYHIHGSNGDLSNRIETRTHHGLNPYEVKIIIDDTTIRK
jgi:hypothetical protein